MVTLIGLQAGTMLGGSVVVESVFALPGLGRLAYEAVVQRDLNTLLGIVFVSALLVIAVNFVVDLPLRASRPAHRGLRAPWNPCAASRAAPPPWSASLLLALVVAMALVAPILFPKDPLGLAGRPLQWPFTNARFWLGTDTTGRDIAAQIFHGARVSLLIGLVATALAITIGIVIGAIAGYYGGIVDDMLMRITEAFQTLPNFLLLLVLVAVFGSDMKTVTIAIGLVSWPASARLTRAEFLTLKSREFVQACRTLGMRDAQIIFREILPNALPPIIVYASVIMAVAILLGKRACLPQSLRPQCALVGQPHRGRPQRSAHAMVCVGHSGRRDPADRARSFARRTGAERCPQSEAEAAMSATPRNRPAHRGAASGRRPSACARRCLACTSMPTRSCASLGKAARASR